MNSNQPRHSFGALRSGFTLLELLIVIAIITVLSVVTVISVGSIARDVKLSTGVNRITSALGTARAEAIRSNTPVMISFRMVKDLRRPGKGAQVEIAVSRWSGDFYSPENVDYDGYVWSERYELVPEIPPQLLPDGIKVACSFADFGLVTNSEQSWAFMSTGPFERVPDTDIYLSKDPGQMIGILFSADGELQTRNNRSVSSSGLRTAKWIDFNGNGILERGTGDGNNAFYSQNELTDEPFMNMAQYLLVYDEQEAREAVDFTRFDRDDFTYISQYLNAKNEVLGTWVNENADRLHFNRYTGLMGRGDS
jgi:prepilin-type N-terminal cleavage/methylation domain-containing protein